MHDQNRIYTVEEAAGVLAVSPRLLRQWIIEGRIRSFMMDDLVRIHGEDLMEFIDRQREAEDGTGGLDDASEYQLFKKVLLEVLRDPDVKEILRENIHDILRERKG